VPQPEAVRLMRAGTPRISWQALHPAGLCLKINKHFLTKTLITMKTVSTKTVRFEELQTLELQLDQQESIKGGWIGIEDHWDL